MKVKLNVSEGRVNCPRRGEVDVDQCFACPELLDVRQDRAGDEIIVCEPRFKSHTDNPLFIRW